MNEKTLRIVLEISIVIGFIIWYTFNTLIPELKEEYGSSDTLINTKQYKNMIEFNIDDTNFIMAINNRNNIYHIFFLDKSSLVLYNKNIENNKIEDSLDKAINLLINNKILNNNSNIIITRYNDEEYIAFINGLKSILNKYNLNNEIIEKTNTLEEKAKELGLSSYNLISLDYYSKSISGLGNSNINSDNKDIKKLTNNVYKKLEEYVFNNNVENQDLSDISLPITLIPSDKSLEYYPTNNSWYYIKDRKVYAYIEIEVSNKKEGYCYQGAIEKRSEGECLHE